jgi:hypothetical protein
MGRRPTHFTSSLHQFRLNLISTPAANIQISTCSSVPVVYCLLYVLSRCTHPGMCQ